MERFRCLRFFVGVIWFCTVAASILIGCSDSASESETQSTDRDNDEELDLLLSQTPAEGSEGGDVVDSNDRPKVERKVLVLQLDFLDIGIECTFPTRNRGGQGCRRIRKFSGGLRKLT